jgi:hypothetical protein
VREVRRSDPALAEDVIGSFVQIDGKHTMTDLALPGSIEPAVKRPNLDKGFNPLTMILFGQGREGRWFRP